MFCVFFPMVWTKKQMQKGKETCTQAKMSVTTVEDVVNIKNWGWRWRSKRRVGLAGERNLASLMEIGSGANTHACINTYMHTFGGGQTAAPAF